MSFSVVDGVIFKTTEIVESVLSLGKINGELGQLIEQLAGVEAMKLEVETFLEKKTMEKANLIQFAEDNNITLGE